MQAATPLEFSEKSLDFLEKFLAELGFTTLPGILQLFVLRNKEGTRCRWAIVIMTMVPEKAVRRAGKAAGKKRPSPRRGRRRVVVKVVEDLLDDLLDYFNEQHDAAR